MSNSAISESIYVEDGSPSENNDIVNKRRTPLKVLSETTAMERMTGLLAIMAIVTSIIAIIVEGSLIVVIAGILSIITGSYGHWQQRQITDILALKKTHETMKTEVETLHNSNWQLKQNVGELSVTVERLEDTEKALDAITNTQGESVTEFTRQVNENKKILSSLEDNHKANILQNLISVLLNCDANNDDKISTQELDNLIEKIQSINKVEIHEDRFREMVKKSNMSVSAVMDVITNLLSEDTSAKDAIFKTNS